MNSNEIMRNWPIPNGSSLHHIFFWWHSNWKFYKGRKRKAESVKKSAILFFYKVLPAIRRRPKMIELLEDRITIRFKSNKVFNLYFSEIESIRLFAHAQKSKRALKYRLLDPFHRIADYSKFSTVMWLNDVVLGILPPFSFGFGSKKGEVLIRKKKGWNRLRLFMPWLTCPRLCANVKLVCFQY